MKDAPSLVFFLSESGNENYYTHALVLLLRRNCVGNIIVKLLHKCFNTTTTTNLIVEISL